MRELTTSAQLEAKWVYCSTPLHAVIIHTKEATVSKTNKDGSPNFVRLTYMVFFYLFFPLFHDADRHASYKTKTFTERDKQIQREGHVCEDMIEKRHSA